jgi:prepilin-type N-terminal cleavage/methylation domain-containing protein
VLGAGKSQENNMKYKRRQRGFTLIELVVVMMIIAILSSIAVNAYGNFVAHSKVQAAEADLIALALRLENELQRNLVYGAHDRITTEAIKGEYRGWFPSQGGSFIYTLDSSPTAYTLTAQGVSGPLSTCVLQMTETGSRTISGCGAITTW